MKTKSFILFFIIFTIATFSIFGYEYEKDPYNHPVKWRTSDMPVNFYIDVDGTPDCTDEFTAIQNAYQTWENACGMNWNYNGTNNYAPTDWENNNGININVWCESSWASVTGTGSGTIAICAYWYSYNSSTCWLTDTDIIYNGENYTWSSSGEAGKMDVQNIATHETGHSLVLLDLYGGSDTEKTMYGYCSTGETKKHTLHQDDIDGARALYGLPANVKDWSKF